MKYLFIFLLFTSFHCPAQKKLLKQATTHEANQQYELASEKYREVLYKNAGSVEAVSGLERTSQKVIDSKLSSYFISRNSGELNDAIRKFEDILKYQEELKYFNIEVQIPAYYFSNYEEDKKRLKSDEELATAREKNKQNENSYNQAISLFEQSHWVDAWDIFSAIGHYKDANSYIDKIKSKAIRISVVENNENKFSKENALRNSLLSEIINLSNPLIRIINRDNLDQIIGEQKLGLSGLMDEQSVADLGKILGVEMILLTRVLNYSPSDAFNTSQNKTAYVASSKQVYDPATQTTNSLRDYYPVTYQEHFIKNTLEVSLQYQLIDVSTAEVLAADVLYEKWEDNIHYASYAGDPNTLYPSNGSVIYTKGKERLAFLKLFAKKAMPLTAKEMDSTIQKVLSKRVAESLDNYFKK